MAARTVISVRVNVEQKKKRKMKSSQMHYYFLGSPKPGFFCK